MPRVDWPKILTALAPKLSGANYNTWLKPARVIEDRFEEVVIAVPTDYAKHWLENHLLAQIKERVGEQLGGQTAVKIIVKRPEPSLKKPADLPLLQTEAKKAKPKRPNPFNPKYTFENFIVGNNNRLAFAAAKVVADKPGEAYNPLFIYGGVGLGKTHLIQAVGNEVHAHNPTKNLIYTSCETFASEFINSLQTKTIGEFKRKYRSVDLFLIDDIQFLSGKEGTQEEFFHTFNILHQTNKQIVITSDRVPKDIPNLEERLSSRFNWGMIADIQTPNFETRLAILQAKAQDSGLIVGGEILEYIANQITSNVRELEGCLTKLATAAKVENEEINIPFVSRTLKDLLQTGGTNLTAKKVVSSVAAYFELEMSDLLGKKRIKELVYPRHLIMYLLRERLGQTFPQIGETLGGKDHTTIIYGVGKIAKNIKTNDEIEKHLKDIERLLY